jgi:uncharacterized protein YdhG (YjbR/CyaY superfamily)
VLRTGSLLTRIVWARSYNIECDMTVRRTPSTIDGYLKSVPEDRRRALKDLRAKIRSIVPSAEECISYRIPAFRLNGAVVAGFCATSKGCSYFPFSGSTLRTLSRDLTRYDQTKSSLHFSLDNPLPTTLVRKLIRTRIGETKKRASRDRRSD